MRVRNPYRRVQQFEDALGAGHGRLQDVVLVAQVLDGPEKALRVLDEGDGGACRHQPAQSHAAALVEDDGHRHRTQEFHRRIKEAVRQDGVLVGFHVGGVDLFELAEAEIFMVEKLEHAHAGDVFLQVSVDARDGDANSPVGFAHGAAKRAGDHHDNGKYGEGEERQLVVHLQHDHHDGDQGEDIAENSHHAGGEQVVQHIHVRSDPRHQPAHGVAVKEAHLQALEVRKKLLAQVVHHALPHHLHGERLRKL